LGLASDGDAHAPPCSFERTIRYHVEQSIKKPEIIARIDLVGAILVFDRLGRKEQENVAQVGVAKQLKRFAELRHDLQISADALRWLIENGINEKYGARPLLALMSRELEGALGRERIVRPIGTKIKGRFVPQTAIQALKSRLEWAVPRFARP
jgi:ATP-dependent Clp protease ATP-binding subunit ClpA